jgi:hypothetical protein
MFATELEASRLPRADLLDSDLEKFDQALSAAPSQDGRLGPSKVNIDVPSISGELEFCPHQIHLLGDGNFTSARANTCVYSNKWMYEVTLGSGGIQQLGWTTINTQWNNEEGVGDHHNSYAYDGSRVKKWNIHKYNYGKSWEKGDVVGCCIDLDEGTMTFHQNGECLGVAFEMQNTIQANNKRSGDQLAYFPAVSLSHNESCWINFGETPFVCPVEGYQPIQPPDDHVAQHGTHRAYICACLRKLTMLITEQHLADNDDNLVDIVSLYGALLVRIVEYSCVETDGKLTVQKCDEFVEMVVELHRTNPSSLDTLLQFMPLVLDSDTLDTLLSFTVHRLCFQCSILRPVHAWTSGMESASSTTHKSGASSPSVSLSSSSGTTPVPSRSSSKATGKDDLHQLPGNKYLRCLVKFLTKEVMQCWINGSHSIYLDILNMLSVKPPDLEEGKELFPNVWWTGSLFDGEYELNELQIEIFINRVRGFAALVSVEDRYRKSLLLRLAHDFPGVFSGFLDFCVNTMRANRFGMYSTSPRFDGDAAVRVFFGALEYFNSVLEPTQSAGQGDIHSKDPALRHKPLCTWPYQHLVHEDQESKDLQRFGGLLSYLKKDYPLQPNGVDRSSSSDETSCKSDHPSSLPNDVAHYHWIFKRVTQLYCLGVKDKIGRATHLATTRGRLAEKMQSLLKENSSKANSTREDLYVHIRKCAWEYIVFFGNIGEEQLCSLANRVIQIFTFYEDSILFRYLPNYLLELVVSILQMLRKTYKDYVPLTTSQPEIILFLLTHVQDERIVNPDVKELILSSVNSLMDADARRREVVVSILKQENCHKYISQFFSSILSCFSDSHNWVTVIDILLKFYSGLGFGFPDDEDGDDINLDLFIDCPKEKPALEYHTRCSLFFSGEFRRFCERNPEDANLFINSIFNHVNWSMSELAISLAEQRPTSGFLPGNLNSTRKCSIMFDMTCKLLTILEFATDVLKYLFFEKQTETPTSSPNSKSGDRSALNVSLVAEVVAHALHRYTCGEGCQELDRVIELNIRGLQSIKKARVLAPVAGILVNMVLDAPDHSSRPNNLLVHNLASNTDRKWSMESFQYLQSINWRMELADGSKKAVCNKFSLLQSPVLQEVLKTSNESNRALRMQQEKALELDREDSDDQICAICCSAPNNCTFKPCEHHSCEACIARHLLNSKKCFFCNSEVVEVVAMDGADL